MRINSVLGLLFIAIGLSSMTSCNENDAININISNCTGNSNQIIKGEGAIVTSTLTLSNFTGIDLSFANNVTISQGATQKVEATGHANIISRIKTTVANNFWEINLEDGCYQDYELSINITIPSLDKIHLSGSGDIVVNDFINQSDLEAKLNGSGQITVNGFEGTENFAVELSGSGDINGNKNISTLKKVNVTLTGSGNYNGFSIDGKDATVVLSGSGNCALTASSTLNATLSGSGNISYKGTPTITQSITGSGKLVNAN